ncbi:MAG TPA: Rab family GTPase [Candidatus Lokiarchaeia archaeon]|nr:Rab family GTPase [Candidatus Lokiarchaeia archaeon]
MSKKIIFVGPPGVGKTTLRKIFFEYESAEQLLQYALDPTYGAESIVLNLGQKIGVFDLAGQENEKWLDGEERDVFEGTTHIIVVIDATSTIDDIVEFTSKVVQVREEICPDSLIFLLVHKIDLLTEAEVKEKKRKLYAHLSMIQKIKIEFTSIVREHFLKTLVVFREIIKATLGEEIPIETVDATLLKDILLVLNQFKDKTKIDRDMIQHELNLQKQRLSEILEILESKQLIHVSESEDGVTEIGLAMDLGKELIAVINTFLKEKLGIIQQDLIAVEIKSDEAPPFIGFLVADESGRTLMSTEERDGAFHDFLGMDLNRDIDLVPSFVSALSSFSKEIKVISMADFNLKGQNSLIYVYEYGKYAFTMFMHKNMNIVQVKDEIQQYFRAMIDDHDELFQKVLETGAVNLLSELQAEAKDWLISMCSTYESKVKNLELFDIDIVKQLYERLDRLSARLTSRNRVYMKDIKALKSRLISAVMEKNLKEIKDISRLAQDFSTKIIS